MTTQQKTVGAPVDMRAVATDEQIVALFTRVNHMCFDVTEAERAVSTLKLALLPTLANQLEDVGPVSEPAWLAHWVKPAEAAYMASGRCTQTDPNKIKLSMGSAVSAQKIAVIGLTNGIKPVEGESLKTYVDRARRILKDRKVLTGENKPIEPRTPAAKPEQAKGAQPSTLNLIQQISKGDDNMADALAFAAGDGKAMFLAWYAMAMTMRAAA